VIIRLGLAANSSSLFFKKKTAAIFGEGINGNSTD